MKFISWLRSVFHLKPIIRCCIKGCNSKAEYSAGVGNWFGGGTIRPLCGKIECLETMKRVEITDEVTITPIGVSIYSLPHITAKFSS